ncbi:MAG: hypothetical protein KA715_01650 [Xanthomonadaceae bacterium]|nr:hypothetical protein [Xanthomonadaceae bacterium]
MNLLATLVFISLAQAQDTGVQHFEDQPLSPKQTQFAAEYFSKKQAELLKDVLDLEEALHEKNKLTVLALGDARIKEIQEALNMPEGNFFERNKKDARLTKLKYSEFKNLDFNSIEDKCKIGEKLFYNRTLKGERLEEFEVIIPELGKAKPTTIDGKIVFKITHSKSKIVFLILENEVEFDSDHLKQYISRLGLRDNPVVLLSEHYASIEEGSEPSELKYKYYPVPKSSAQKIKTWWRANYVAPDKGALITTVMSVFFQVSTTEGISAANYFLGNSQVWDHTTTFLTAGFGTVFGLWGSFYNNITAPKDPLNPKSRRNALVRRILISSASFAYTLQILNHGVHSLSLATSGGWLNNLRMISNTVVNNSVKDRWKMVNDIRDEMGVSRGQVNIAGVDVKRTQLERNVIDQAPRTLKMIDLMNLDVMEIPIGSMLFYSSYFWTQGLIVKYAEKVNFKHKDVLRERWEKFKDENIRFLKQPHKVIFENIKKIAKWSAGQKNELILYFRNTFASGIFSKNKCAKQIQDGQNEVNKEIIPFLPVVGDAWLDLPRKE